MIVVDRIVMCIYIEMAMDFWQDNVSDIVSEGGVQRLYDGYFIVQVAPLCVLLIPMMNCSFDVL